MRSARGRFRTAGTRDFFSICAARHSDKLQTFADYNYSSSNQGDLASTLNSASAGLSYWPTKDLTATFGLRGENNQTNQFAAHAYGVDGSGRYQRALPLGVAQANYGFRYDQRDQAAVANQTSVIGERVTLVGTTFNALSHQRVIAGSVVVNNSTRTQTFVEGFDYTLTVVGLETRVQRLIGGNIVDGQEVLVDYSYDVGGTYAYAQTDQTFNVNWGCRTTSTSTSVTSIRRRTSSPARRRFRSTRFTAALYGARADVPLKMPFDPMVGGSFESEDRRETISPYRREAEDVYIQAEEPVLRYRQFPPLDAPHAGRLCEFDTERQSHRVTTFRYWSRHWFGLDVSAGRQLRARHRRPSATQPGDRLGQGAMALPQGDPDAGPRAYARNPGHIRKGTHAFPAPGPEGFLIMTARMRAAAALCVVLTLSACAPAVRPVAEERAPLVWPDDPAAARIAFVKTFSRPDDLGIAKGFFQRLADVMFGGTDARLVRPMAVVAVGGILYVADPGAKGVHRFDQEKGDYTLLRAAGERRLPSPVGLARGAGGEVYVTDSVLAKVFVIRPGAEVAEPVPLRASLGQPTGIAFDPASGRLFVVDTAAHRVNVFTRDGTLESSFGKRGTGRRRVQLPDVPVAHGRRASICDRLA